MQSEYRTEPVEKPTDEMWNVIGGGINQYNHQYGGPEGFQRVCFELNGPNGEVAGGLIGDIYWGWFYINLMFVKEELRGQGYGHQLLVQAETEALKRGAKNVYLDTFSFQSPEFYKKHDYRVFGELQDFPQGFTRYFMTKQL
jgi:GNAT superfamily N-acetyltransferase